ncbi:Aminotransferase class-III [Penicillium camemberti]|uniref:Aminotransferase class-III n=1 Tax=Penicillium camemberti (strain FM 013) TaxID=1429867 RepID=A0A0G4NZB1_PENC3|nr:Aminotransferase class-III [Penicillium camemberti]
MTVATISMAVDSPQMKCPLENHSQENTAEEQCYLIEGLRTNVHLIVDKVQTGVGATGRLSGRDHVHAFSLAYLGSTLSTFRASMAKSFDVNIGGSSHQKVQHMHQGL